MKKALLIISLFSISLLSKATDYYWVGGTGNWSEVSTHWATSSGGGTFHSVIPTIFDNVYFDGSSFTSSGQTLTLDVTTPTCNDMIWTGVTNTPTFNGNNKTLKVYGSLTLVSGITTSTLNISFESTTSGKTITSAGKTINNSIHLIF